MTDPTTRVPRNVKILGLVSLLTDASSEAVYPILPLFVTNVLHAPVSAVGLIESIAEATGALMRVGSGWLSDRFGKRKGLVAAGYTLSNIAKPLLAFTASWPSVLFLRWADRVGKGIRTAPRDALIADSSTSATRGRDFGFHRALDTVGAAIATPIGSLSDRIGRRRVLIGGFGGYALVYAGFALAQGRLAPWLLFAAYGIPYAMTESITRAYVVDLVPAGLRATAVGSYTFVLGLAALPSSTGAGIVWDKVAHWAPFAIDAALMGSAAIALAFAGRALACAKDSANVEEDAA